MQLMKKSRSVAISAVILVAGHSAFAQVNRAGTRAEKGIVSKADVVTKVAGESWLMHLNRPFNETSMGKTWHLGPTAPEPGEATSPGHPDLQNSAVSQTLTLKGSDLYRIDCQGCHGESGQGAPPEINSVINPVRATSAELVMERMKRAGLDISRADAVKLAQQSNIALLQRLHNGGENMPPFPHLNDAEVRSLLSYLKQLAGVPGAEREQLTVKETPVRVGEHIVKSTCHTCHSAAGPDPDPQQIWEGAIPPLSALLTRKSRSEFIRKVTHGAPILMGATPALYRGRMPVLDYLSEDEAADVYLYLTQYPPGESANLDATVALSHGGPPAGGGTPAVQKAQSAPLLPDNRPANVQPPSQGAELHTAAVLTAVAAVILLLAGGLGFTMREFQRLTTARSMCRQPFKTKPAGRTDDAAATFQRAS